LRWPPLGAPPERDDGRAETEEKEAMSVKKITPVLFAAEIEPCVKFWVERFGFEKTVEAPEGTELGFAIVEKGGVELMYQPYASADRDAPAAPAQAVRKGPAFLYLEVENLDETIGALKSIEVVMLGADHVLWSPRDGRERSGGHFVSFAQTSDAP
jgi:hypothetical protein